MVRASRKIEAIDRAPEEFFALPVGHAELIHLFGRQSRVRFLLPPDLPRARTLDPLADRGTRFAARLTDEFGLGKRWHFDLDVYAVKQRPRNFSAITRYLVRGAAALAARMPKVAAGTVFCCLFATGAGLS
jgi:hypothetical protein